MEMNLEHLRPPQPQQCDLAFEFEEFQMRCIPGEKRVDGSQLVQVCKVHSVKMEQAWSAPIYSNSLVHRTTAQSYTDLALQGGNGDSTTIRQSINHLKYGFYSH